MISEVINWAEVLRDDNRPLCVTCTRHIDPRRIMCFYCEHERRKKNIKAQICVRLEKNGTQCSRSPIVDDRYILCARCAPLRKKEHDDYHLSTTFLLHPYRIAATYRESFTLRREYTWRYQLDFDLIHYNFEQNLLEMADAIIEEALADLRREANWSHLHRISISKTLPPLDLSSHSLTQYIGEITGITSITVHDADTHYRWLGLWIKNIFIIFCLILSVCELKKVDNMSDNINDVDLVARARL